MIHKTTRSILSVLLAALLLVTSIPLTPAFAGEGAVSLQSESGEGRALEQAADGTYLIYTAENLKEFAAIVNGTDGTSTDSDANAKLMNNIDLKDVCGESNSWTPIGNSSPYSGTFNGDGHTISGLYIDITANNQGLFGYLSGTVQNLSVSGSVKGDDYVGGIVGQNGGRITDCDFTGSVSGVSYVGGVVGYNIGPVKNCYNTGNISGKSVGGVVGYNHSDGSVTNSYNTGAVSGVEDVGGVVGYNDGGSVTNSYNTGAVSGVEDIGGVVGENSGSSTVENCYNTGTVTGTDDRVGGVVGWNISSVKNCYNTGTVTGTDDYVGGVVGDNRGGSVTGCYFLKTTGVNESLQGIGNDSAEDETAVKDLNALCENFKGDTTDTWIISGILGRPVLQENPEGGLGSPESPYQISTADQLENFRDIVNSENGQQQNKAAHAVLMENINLNNEQWEPIGNSSDKYTGTFNGNGHTISGLYINDSSADYQGLFGYVDQGGTVQNLSVSGTVNSSYVGGVVGLNSGNVENCYNTGTVTGTVNVSGNSSVVGGVVGYNNGSVTNCYNTGEVSGKISVGGVVGYNNSGTVKNCYNTGNVSGGRVGGVVGYNISSGTSAIVENCYYQIDKGATFGIGGTTADDTRTVAKTAAEFQSGEVAYLLGEAWGQSALGTKDSLPTLVALDKANAQKVYQVTFDYGTSFADNDDRYDYRYANANDNVTLPTSTDPIPSYEGHTLTGWQDESGQTVQGESVTITADTTYIAEWTANTYTITVTAGSGGTVSGSGEYSEGTEVTVTATPATGYHFVNWTENGTEVSTEATFTFNATVDRNLIAIFAKNEDPTPTPTPAGPSTGDSSGWDDIRDELENAENGDEITIDMGDETKVPAEIFESLAGKDVDVTFDLGDIQWSVDGADIPTDTDFTDLDLGVDLDTSGIPVNVINTITGEVGTVQITLAHDGEFGFTMTLTAPLGKENAGYWANLYHYDEDAEALNFEAAAEIDEDGNVKIPFTHASQYAIVIDTHSHATVDVSDLFIDIAPDAWYKDAVQYAYDNGLMTGVSDTEFAPEATTTRAMIVSILARLEGVTTAQAAGFADVDDNDWYATAVNWAANVGVVNGYEDNTFKPNTAITREQLAAILMNYASYKGEDVSNRADLANYTDQPSTWAKEAISWSVAEGLLTGVTADTLQPQGAATRAQVAAILQRFLDK